MTQGTDDLFEMGYARYAAELGNGMIMLNTGIMHRNGEGAVQSDKKAWAWHHRALMGGEVKRSPWMKGTVPSSTEAQAGVRRCPNSPR